MGGRVGWWAGTKEARGLAPAGLFFGGAEIRRRNKRLVESSGELLERHSTRI